MKPVLLSHSHPNRKFRHQSPKVLFWSQISASTELRECGDSAEYPGCWEDGHCYSVSWEKNEEAELANTADCLESWINARCEWLSGSWGAELPAVALSLQHSALQHVGGPQSSTSMQRPQNREGKERVQLKENIFLL